MRKFLLLSAIIFFATCSNGQRGFGFDVGFSTSKSPMAAIKYYLDDNAFSLGFTYQLFNNALGDKVNKTTSTFIIGHGNYFFTADAGYTRVLNENFSVGGEISVGEKKYYHNYSDNSYSEGGYHVVYKTKTVFGIGGIVIYNISDNFGVFADLNSIRQAAIGIQLKFVK
jgi:hypothetical protein